jgi:hypothetical protein
MRRAGRAGAAVVVSVVGAAIAGCGQEAPPDLSYVLVELDAVDGAKDAMVVVEPPPPASSTTLCVRLASEGSPTPASFVLYRKHGADPAPTVQVIVTSYTEISGDDVDDGSQFTCPTELPPLPVAVQLLTFGFCANESVKVQVQVGSTCLNCAKDEVCGAGLTPDGQHCPDGTCCIGLIPDACALEQAPTTAATAP